MPIITLTTDFGLSDHYVGTMKGVMLSRCPEAQIVDISHEVREFSVWEAAYTIGQAAPFFPVDTVHVVVVDPGVGTSRKPILAEVSGQRFIAPDNGVLSFVLRDVPDAKVWEITNRSLFLSAISATFHGRDVFAPVAAAMANGDSHPEDLGARLERPVMLAPLDPVASDDGYSEGRVLSVDHFGNVITNVPAACFPDAALQTGQTIIRQWRETFGQAQPHELFLYRGSSGFVEIGMNRANAADVLSLRPGDPIRVTC